MGLNMTHGCWDGPYSGFNDFRCAVAVATGYDPDADPDRPDVETSYAIPNRSEYTAVNYQGWWEETPENILDVFFVHSDCDGYIMPWHAGPLADALEKCRPDLDEDWHEALDNFVGGLRWAADTEQVVAYQ